MEKDQSPVDGHDDGIDIKAVFCALRRRKWIILGTLLLGLTAAGLLVTLIPPRYTATSAVLIEPHDIRVYDDAKPLVDGRQNEESFVENQKKIIAARSNVQQIIANLGLHQDPEFNAGTPWPGGNALRQIKDRLREQGSMIAGFTGQGNPDHSQPAASGAGTAISEATFRRFSERLEVSRNGQSGVLSVSFTSTDPEKAARIVNAVVDTYIRDQLAAKSAAIARSSRWLTGQIEQLRAEVRQSEKATEDYRAAHHLRENPEGNVSAQPLLGLKVDLNTARADRVTKEARLRHVYDLRAKGDGYKPLTELTSSPIIANLVERDQELLRQEAQLSTSYGGKHPLVLQARAEREKLAAKVNQEVRNIIRNLEGEVTVARAREQALQKILDEARDQSATAGQAGIQLRELEREAASKRAVYEGALLRFTEIREQAGLSEPDARVISAAAVPSESAFPKVGMMLAVGGVGSLMLGTALAALREHLDHGLRTGRQVEEALGLSSLGLVPRIEGIGRRRTPHQYLLERPSSTYAEAVKSIVMRLHLGPTDPPPRVVMVTSALPGEGKTTLALSLGASVARSGVRTVVVDLDMRHPTVGRDLELPIRTGLLAFMAGERDLDQITHEHPREANLHIIPVEGRTASPTDLLASPMMRLLLNELRRRYDYIVLDSPPVLGFSDASIAALLADAVIFVVRWEKTSEAIAANALEALQKYRAPVIGAAVTQVDVRRHVGYGYGDAGEYYGKYHKYFAN